MTKRHLLLILSFVLLVTLVALPVAAQSYPDPGTGSTYTELANKTANQAQVSVYYYDQNGSSLAGPSPTIPGNGSFLIDPASSQLPQGFNGAGVASSNQPLAAVVQTNWTGSPSGDGFEIDTYTGVSAGSTKICFPSLFKANQQVAAFTVQNTGTSAANVQISYYRRNGTAEGQFTDAIPMGAQHTYDLRTPGATVPNLTAPWDGSAIVESTNGQPLAGVGVITQAGRSSQYNAANCGGLSGSTVLVAPSHFRSYVGGNRNIVSALNIQNLENAAAAVTLVYTPRDPALPSKTINTTIPALSAIGYNTSSGFEDLGDNWAGVVRITSDKGVVATVITQWFRGSGPEAGYYSAFNVTEGKTKWWVPNVRRVGSPTKTNSAILLQNVGAADASVTTKFYNRQGVLVHTDGPITLASGGAGTVNTFNMTQLGTAFEGHAVVESNQPLAVALNSIDRNPSGSATTNGVPE